jgi:DNA replication initiation complex subunit (GINS family)
VCGFSHDIFEDRASGKMANAEILAEEREWYPTLSYMCKQCRESFDEVQDVVEHCRTAHSSAPRWLQDTNWRQRASQPPGERAEPEW